jgi:hypothetical protein
MKRDYKFFLSLAGSLALSLSTLFFSRPAASEEAQILPPAETISSCLDRLPILEADEASMGVEANPLPSGNQSSFNSEAVAAQTVANTGQISQVSQPESSKGLPTTAPLTVPQIEPPPTSQASSSVQPFDKSLSVAPSTPSNKLTVKPLAESVIPASPSLPRTAVPISASTEDLTPHTRYLPEPPDPSSSAVTPDVIDNKPTSDSPLSKPSDSKPLELQTAIGCVPAVDSAQNGVLPETAETKNTDLSHKNSDIEKSMKNAQRSLKGFRPF